MQSSLVFIDVVGAKKHGCHFSSINDPFFFNTKSKLQPKIQAKHYNIGLLLFSANELITASSVMVEMHLHYLWVCFGPSRQPWFRQHLTTLQVFHCVFNFARLVLVMIWAPSCDFPWQNSVLSFSYITFCLYFYISSYLQLYVSIQNID